MSRWSTLFLLPEQSTFDDLCCSKESLVQVLWECLAIQAKKIRKLFSIILMKVHPVLSALLIFESSFVLIFSIFVHGMQNEPCQTFPLPTKVAVRDLVFLKINMFPPIPIHEVEIKIVCMKICKELLVRNSWKVLEPRDSKSQCLCKKF